MARDGQMELSADLAEDDLAHIRPGQSATVTLPRGASVQGHVRLISPQIEAQTKLGEVRVLLPTRSDIRAGGFGRVVFGDAARHRALVVATNAAHGNLLYPRVVRAATGLDLLAFDL